MRVAIVGAGFVGLAAALRLVQRGVSVSLYEAARVPGGLASGFSGNGWEWPVERFYHHIFTNDSAIIRLSRELSWPPFFFRPTTSLYIEGVSYPFDSAGDLLSFPHLPLTLKVRMGLALSFLKIFPFWQPLERLTAQGFLRGTMGNLGYQTVWEPLLRGKFGASASLVNAAWFWARVHKRTPDLGYFRRGFQGLADRLTETIIKQGGRTFFGQPIQEIISYGGRLRVRSSLGLESFDRVLVTVGTPLFLRLSVDLPDWYRAKLQRLSSMDALVLLLVLRKPFMQGIYWLNITDRSLPFLVMVEHTNMITPRHYGGNHLVYLGAYLPSDHRFFRHSPSGLRRLAIRQLRAIRRNFDPKDILDCFVFHSPQAQPIVPVSYSKIRPGSRTPVPNLFLGNMDLVYPWDRGTNYAVELGERLADEILQP